MDFYNQGNYYTNYNYNEYPEAIEPSQICNYLNNNTNTYNSYNLRNRSYTADYTISQTERIMTDSDLQEALNMIRDSVMDEANDEAFYSMLINQAISDEDKDIIRIIRDNEITHNKLLRDVYYALTGTTLPQSTSNTQMQPMSYLDNLKKSLMSEVEAANKYRKIMSAMPDKSSSSSIMHILVDELRHADLYNYLISKTKFNMLDKSSLEPTD